MDTVPHDTAVPPAALELCRQLQRTVKAVSLYGEGHPAVAPAIEALASRYRRLEEPLRLAFAPDQLLVGEHEIQPLDPPLAALTHHLHRLGIARLSLLPGADDAEVAAFARILAHGTEGGAALPHFPMEGLAYATMETVGAAAPGSEEAFRERQRRLWKALATGNLGREGILDQEAEAFLEEMLRREGSLERFTRGLAADAVESAGPLPTLPGKMVARLLTHLDRTLGATPRRAEVAADLSNRLLELPARLLAETLAAEELPESLVAQGLSQQPTSRLLETMAALVRAEGADSPRLAHCLGAFLSPEARAEELLPEIEHRLHAAAEAGDGEHLAVWRRVEEIAFQRSGERYMSSAYEEQLEDFAAAHFPNLSRYQAGAELDEALLATLEPKALAVDHTHLLLDLLASERDPKAFERVVEDLCRRLSHAVEEQDFALAALISGDLRRAAGSDSPHDPEFKRILRRHLGELDLEQQVDRTLAELQHAEAVASQAFYDFLAAFERSITPHLLDRLAEEEDRRIRRRIMDALGRFAADLVPELGRRLEGAPWYYARNLAHLLGDAGTEEAVRPLVRCVRHPDPRVRKEALASLRRIGSPRAVPFATQVLAEERRTATRDDD
ncbi:MAG: HEAT repeat domain-containing protein, partial [Nitrospirae bacterium]